MRRLATLIAVVCCAGWAPLLEAREKPIEELPKDIWTLAWAWTEPIKGVARETQRYDPVRGLWFGLVEGSVKSFERTTSVLLPGMDTNEQNPNHQGQGKQLLRYTF